MSGAEVKQFFQPVVQIFIDKGTAFRDFIPDLILGLITLVILLIIAKIIQFIVGRVCKTMKVDLLAEKIGMKMLLAKFGVSAPLSKVLSKILYWMIALFAVKTAADMWGIKDISNFIVAVINFLPQLFISIFILLAGLLGAEFARKAITQAVGGFGFQWGGIIGNFFYGLIAVMIMTIVLSQLNIETDLLNASVKIFLAALALAIAISLGLGLRPIARNAVSGIYARDLFPPGSILEVDGSPARVREVGVVTTQLETHDGSYIVVPNADLVTKTNWGRRTHAARSEKD